MEKYNMSINTHEDNIRFESNESHKGGNLIDESNGAKNGFCMGISYYHLTEFSAPGVHEDQEGFYVLEGFGAASIGGEVFDISPGSSFVALDGVPHSIRRHKDSLPVKVLWSHGAI